MAIHVIQGSGAPAITPTKIGEHYTDITNKDAYLSVGTSSSADWKLASGSGGTVTSVTLTQPSAGITLTNSGVSQTTAATSTLALANDLAAVEGLSTNGVAVRTGTSTWTTVTAPSGAIVGTTDSQTLTNKSIAGSQLTGAYTASGLTMTTARLLGRTTASTGASEEITVGSGLSLSAGTLTASGGSGTVTSVSATVPTELAVTGSPITTTGTLAFTWNSGSGNKFIATPSGGGAGAYTGRAIVASDIPTLNQSTSGNAATATALATPRTINTVSFDGTSNIVVTAAAGTLTGATLASGVTASSLTSAAGGSFGTAAFTAATAYEVPLTFSTGLTRTTNTITSNAVNLAGTGSGGVTGTLPTARGGTNLTSYVLGDIVYASAANVLSALSGPIAATPSILVSVGTGSVANPPAWVSFIANTDYAPVNSPIFTGTVTAAALSVSGTSTLSAITGTGTFTINASGASAMSIGGGTSSGAINIGASSGTQNVNLGTGAGVKNTTVGSSNTTSTTTIQSGSGNLGIQTGSANNVNILTGASTGTFNVGTSTTTQTANLNTGAGVKTTNVGSSNTTSTTTITAGSGNLNLTSASTIVTGDLKLGTAGNGLYIKEGTNATMGRSTLVGGTVTVSTTKATSTMEVFLTTRVSGGTIGTLSVGTVVGGTSFVINSSSALDTSQISWLIVEPA